MDTQQRADLDRYFAAMQSAGARVLSNATMARKILAAEVPAEPVEPPVEPGEAPVVVVEPEPVLLPAQRLRWAPPADWGARGEVVIDLKSGVNVKLTEPRDYLLRAPVGEVLTGSLNIWASATAGCRIKLIGGEWDAGTSNRAVHLNIHGADYAHVEGIRVTGAGLQEGFNIDARRPGSTVVIQNAEISPITGTYAGHHADIIQTWAGPHRLLVANVEGTSDYQWCFLSPQQFGHYHDNPLDFGEWEFHDCMARMVANPATGNHGYAYWLTERADSAGVAVPRLTTSGLHVVSAIGRRIEVRGSQWKYTEGEPATPVLLGAPGASYVSPGYLSSPPVDSAL